MPPDKPLETASNRSTRGLLRPSIQRAAIAAGIEASMLFWFAGLIMSLRVSAYSNSLSDSPRVRELAGLLHMLADDCSFLAYLLGAAFLLTCIGIFIDYVVGDEEEWGADIRTLTGWGARITFVVMLIFGARAFYQPDRYSPPTFYLVRDLSFVSPHLLQAGEAYFLMAGAVTIVAVLLALNKRLGTKTKRDIVFLILGILGGWLLAQLLRLLGLAP